MRWPACVDAQTGLRICNCVQKGQVISRRGPILKWLYLLKCRQGATYGSSSYNYYKNINTLLIRLYNCSYFAHHNMKINLNINTKQLAIFLARDDCNRPLLVFANSLGRGLTNGVITCIQPLYSPARQRWWYTLVNFHWARVRFGPAIMC